MGMQQDRFTIKAQEAVAAAQELARRNGNPELYPEHLLLALLDQELPRELVPDADALRAQADATLAQRPRIEGSQVFVTTPAAIGEAPGMPAAEATSLLIRRQWREGDGARLEAAAARLGCRRQADVRVSPESWHPNSSRRPFGSALRR